MRANFWHSPWFLLLMAGILLGIALGVLVFYGFPPPATSAQIDGFSLPKPVVTPAIEGRTIAPTVVPGSGLEPLRC